MKQIVCAVFDSAVQAFGRPFFIAARGAAVRSFIDEVNRKDADAALAAHPEDYTLHQVAVFDDVSGEFENAPEVLMRGKDAIATNGDKFV